jgi:hypothetical protein
MNPTEWDEHFPHFAPEEYFSPEGLVLFHERNIIPCDLSIMQEVERFRQRLNWSRDNGGIVFNEEIKLYINTDDQKLRGFVTPREWWEERTKSEGQLYSYHLWCAVDVSSNVYVESLFTVAKMLCFGGIIKYPWGLHLDLRRGVPYVAER